MEGRKKNFNTTSVFIKLCGASAPSLWCKISIQLLFSLNRYLSISCSKENDFNTTSVFIKRRKLLNGLEKNLSISIQLLFSLNINLSRLSFRIFCISIQLLFSLNNRRKSRDCKTRWISIQLLFSLNFVLVLFPLQK